MAIKLPEVHLSFWLLKGSFHFQKLQEERFNVQKLLILSGADVPTLHLLPEGEELLIWNLQKNVH
jgi:hypothetical protein